MKLSRAQKKAEMEKAAEEMIEALLDWLKEIGYLADFKVVFPS
jgi:ribosomal protein S8